VRLAPRRSRRPCAGRAGRWRSMSHSSRRRTRHATHDF
jgi:hypothetical protein